jgi:hypothetical protein
MAWDQVACVQNQISHFLMWLHSFPGILWGCVRMAVIRSLADLSFCTVILTLCAIVCMVKIHAHLLA